MSNAVEVGWQSSFPLRHQVNEGLANAGPLTFGV